MTYEEFIAEWESPSDRCRVRTSGSTGTPKEILLPKDLMIRSAKRTNTFFRLGAGAHIHSCIAADFIGGKMMAVRASVGELTLTWESPSSRPEVLTRFEGRLPALVALVPAQMPFILDHLPEAGCGDTVWLLGGSAIDPGLRHRITEAGVNAWETYGMTETASHIALRRVTDGDSRFSPLPDVVLSLTSEGCLVIEQYGERIVTNDLADLAADGTFRILGRADNVIITGGRKVNPEKVEATLNDALRPFGVEEVMLIGEADEKWGSRLVLLMTTRDGHDDSATLIARAAEAARNHLDRHEVPKEYRIVGSLPRTPNGKLKRRG